MLSGGDNPHQLSIQLTAETDDGRSASGIIWLLVINGYEQLENSAFSMSESKRPTMVIRVPPGDGSSTTIESGSTECMENTFQHVNESGLENESILHLGGGTTVCFGIGITKCEKQKYAPSFAFIKDASNPFNWSK